MSVTSINTSNGSGITATPSSGDVNINSLVAGLNGIVISGGTGKQSIISASDVDFNSVSLDSASGKTVKLIADSTLANNDIYTLPPTLPSATGQVLSSDTSGVMTWATGTGGGNFSTPSTQDLNMATYKVTNVGELSIVDTVGTNTTSFVGGTGQSGNIIYTLPTALPVGTDQVLLSSTSGIMTWTTALTNPLNIDLNVQNNSINNIKSLKFLDTDAVTPNTTTISCGNQTSDINYTLPTSIPGAGQVLSSDASGVMSWVTGITNPLTVDLNANNKNITNLNQLNIYGTTASPAYFSITNTTASKQSQLQISPSQAPSLITLVLPPDAGNTNYVLAIDNIATGNIVNTKWMSTTLPANIVYNPLTATLNANTQNISQIGQLEAGSLTLNPVTGSSGILTISHAGDISTSFVVDGTQASNITYTLPTAYPSTSGYILASTTSGTMSWVANSGGGGGGTGGDFTVGGDLVDVGNIYYVNIPVTTGFNAGKYIFSVNWHFATSATFTADNTLFTGIGTASAGASIYSTDTMVQNGQVLGTTAVTTSSFNVNFTVVRDIYLNIGIDDTTKVSLTSNSVVATIYWYQIA